MENTEIQSTENVTENNAEELIASLVSEIKSPETDTTKREPSKEDIAKMNILKGRDTFWDFQNQKIVLGGADRIEDIEELFKIALKDMEEKEAKEMIKAERNSLLEKGSLTEDGKMWFNYDSASMFIQAFSTLMEDETLPWFDANRVRVNLTYEEARKYASEIRKVLQSVYGL